MHRTQILCLSLLNKFFDSKKTQLLPAKENKKKSFGYVKNKRRKMFSSFLLYHRRCEKCVENISHTFTSSSLNPFKVLSIFSRYDLLQNSRTTKWNLFVKR